MPSRKKPVEQKPLMKRLLDGIMPSKGKRRPIVRILSDDNDADDFQSLSREAVVTRSSSDLKRHEEVPQKTSTSPEPKLASSGLRPTGSSRPDDDGR
ncbi:unnamed protein product [Adineta ricciae]|uniref:Uncharacterized protein n=1 Tax=Adineta ricciae TaxID=249248 RepID=A0A815VUP2_ADIRI|nr:unnamed protein product [Adineta ricciae]CAF1626512.1 unnamed protein product [Adineta ricciae]